MSYLSIERLTVFYPGSARPTVDGLSLQLPRGQIGCLLGASGCGKTTVLRTLAGFIHPTEGAIDLVLTPRLDRHSRTNALLLRTEVHQVFGTWSGTVRAEDGREIRLEGAQGFAEEARNTW